MNKLITLVLVIVSLVIFTSNSPLTTPPTKALNKFITEHAQNASVYMMHNGNVVLNYRSDLTMPVSSTTKIMVATAYADQIAKEQISKHQKVDLDLIGDLYFPAENNKKFEHWIKENESATLGEVIKLMIQLDSDAIEEFLIGKITLEKLSRIIASFDINDHDKILPPVSMQLASLTINKSSENVMRDFKDKTLSIHNDLIGGSQSINNYKSFFTTDENVLNDLRPNATTKIYTELVDNVLGYHKVEDNVIDVLLPFLLDVGFDENGNERYLNQPYMIQSKTTSNSYNVVIYNKEPNSDARFVSSYFFDNLTKKELSKLQKYFQEVIDEVKDGGSIDAVVSSLSNIAFD